jgi:hypothetical protein
MKQQVFALNLRKRSTGTGEWAPGAQREAVGRSSAGKHRGRRSNPPPSFALRQQVDQQDDQEDRDDRSYADVHPLTSEVGIIDEARLQGAGPRLEGVAPAAKATPTRKGRSLPGPGTSRQPREALHDVVGAQR